MANMIEVQFESHADEILKEFKMAKARALERIGLRAERHAKNKCPKDTGTLQNSITHVTDDDSVYIGTDLEYAPYVELGTIRMSPRPYLRPAANYTHEYEMIIADCFGGIQ